MPEYRTLTEASLSSHPWPVAVVGAGPAGLFAASKLAKAGCHVVLINRDIKPGGLAEYGIYYDKHKMKNGLRKQFQKILEQERIEYIGGVAIGESAALRLEDLDALGFSAILFAIGAQGTRTLGLPGEEACQAVYHAKDLVYHYNQLPPFASNHYPIGRRVGILGMGNVMLDIAHWMICDHKVEEVVVIARRGPAERAYTDKEMREVALALDKDDLQREFQRIRPSLLSIEQDPDALYQEILTPCEKAEPIESPTRLRFRFFASPTRLIPDPQGRLAAVEIEHNLPSSQGGIVRIKGSGHKEILPLNTLVYAIGDQVDPSVGLPFKDGKYLTPSSPHPRDPERARYEVLDPATQDARRGWFLGGWSRQASDGLVGKARLDGEIAADEILAFLASLPPPSSPLSDPYLSLTRLLDAKSHPYATQADLQTLHAIEARHAAEAGLPLFKFSTDHDMLAAIKKNPLSSFPNEVPR